MRSKVCTGERNIGRGQHTLGFVFGPMVNAKLN
jgi:hypothetical protein